MFAAVRFTLELSFVIRFRLLFFVGVATPVATVFLVLASYLYEGFYLASKGKRRNEERIVAVKVCSRPWLFLLVLTPCWIGSIALTV